MKKIKLIFNIFFFISLLFQSCQGVTQKSDSYNTKAIEKNLDVVANEHISVTVINIDTVHEESSIGLIEDVHTKISFEEIKKEEFLKYFSQKTESVDTVKTMVSRTDTSFLIRIEEEHIAFKTNPKDESEVSSYLGWLRAIDYYIINTNYYGGAHYSETILMNGINGDKYPLNANSDFGFNRFEVSPNQKYIFLSLDNLFADDSYILIKKVEQQDGIYTLKDYTDYSAQEDWMIQKMAWVDDESFVLKIIYNGRNFNMEDDYEDTEESNMRGKIGFLKGVIE